jgi:hypothetical protein
MAKIKELVSWKDKRIHAINRLSKIKGWGASPNNPYFEQVYRIYASKATNLQEFKHEEKNLTVSGYYFDGKDSYTIYEDDHGNSTMEKQATKVQQGYRDNAAFKLKQIKENENNGHQ